MSLPSINADFRLSSTAARRIFSVLIVSALLLTASFALAESPKKKFGRLADGRAYRVDASGFQLVDQVAELEVRVDELRRQLEASENEIKSQARTIKNLGGTAASGSVGISEKNLVKSAKLKRVAADEPPNCNQLVSSLYLRVSTLESQLKSAKMNPGQMNPAMAKLDCPAATKSVEACDYESEKNPLWNQVQRLQQELMSGPSKERVASQGKSLGLAEKNLRALQSKLSAQDRVTQELELALASKESELGSANSRLSALNDELTEMRAENEKIRSRAALSRSKQVARATQVRNSVVKTTASTPTARRLQQKFSRQLQKIQSLILRRKDLLDAKEARGGSYRTSPLMTANGMSLDSLRRGVAKLDWSSNSATIDDGLKEITTILQKDIRNLS